MTDIGDTIPDMALTRPDGSEVRASDFAGKPWVLYFYPKDDTTGCTKEAQEFSAQLPAFVAAGVSVLGVSKDPPKKHLKFIEKYGLTVPLASDAETDGLAEAMGVWIEKSMYGKKYMGMDRSTFLIGKDGKVAKVWRKVKVAGHVDEVLASATAL
ncbi:peroxiredoxin [Blastomonas fulva]|jgi:peroxiredoxin Q/BCP|uniref:thioredoxin-dependent peroxiredoxin n=1 Tax=Blastomonas fulva TaxID=1550728 RepID=A0ABN5B9H8_9SPHN|nr:peroxiredoxin [Blastomonas fulva]ASR52946.1 peroxiredoxin [Blastomonas fulva]